ncbi:AMP-binding protein [Variovorax sp. J22R133]|uniref:AMP-binding protein n=1 Tax=Variovorax brevis TaxID=3053503 RepID=UPI002576666E|nr:AMP-binding protein [Variovorax sp. J22R133]MDM0116494.1 AMP-binding protein [Variovorax sp. J22R133]
MKGDQMHIADILARLRGQPTRLVLVDAKGVETVRTFHDLHCDTLRVAQRMRAMGIGSGCRVGIAAPSGYAWMAWDLACVELGCISVALANERPTADWDELIDTYQLSLLAVDSEWIASASAPDARVQPIEIDAPAIAVALLSHPLQHAPGTHSLVFSSGTTGKTKSLVINRAGTEHLLNLYFEAFGVVPGERFLTFLPFANYQQRMIYYFCLHHGVEFVYVPFPLLFSGLKKHRPSFVIAPPVLYETLQVMARASAGAQGANDPDVLTRKLAELTGGNIRYMITGMAPIKRAALNFFWRHGIALYEAFGITEAGMVAWNKPGLMRVGSVGQPAEPGSVTLSDEGEVIIRRNALLSLGYHEASEEDSRSTFLASDTVATGDIAQFDSEGFLHIIGRKKDAIITSNGEKFHPEPIESLIQADARASVAVVLANARHGLTAVISTKAQDDTHVLAALRAHVRQINQDLPAQQQIKEVLFTHLDFSIENGLRTKNMKLNRKAIAKAFLEGG